MSKKAMSVTLDEANVLWLKARARVSHKNNVSRLIDGLVSEARLGKSTASRPYPSVVGMVDLSDDPQLTKFDASLREMWDEYFEKPFLMEEAPPAPRRKNRLKRG